MLLNEIRYFSQVCTLQQFTIPASIGLGRKSARPGLASTCLVGFHQSELCSVLCHCTVPVQKSLIARFCRGQSCMLAPRLCSSENMATKTMYRRIHNSCGAQWLDTFHSIVIRTTCTLNHIIPHHDIRQCVDHSIRVPCVYTVDLHGECDTPSSMLKTIASHISCACLQSHVHVYE